LIIWKPTGFYSRVNTRDCLKFFELNMKWLLLPRWLVSTPIQIYRVGGLTITRNGETLVKRGNRFDMTSIVRGHVPGQQEPPLCPVHSIRRGGRV
jgi:hypothetical protein